MCKILMKTRETKANRYAIPPSLLVFFSLWRYPRMVVWVILTVLAGLLARLPFTQVPIIPHYLDFHPGIVLVPLAGVFFGPAGAWGSAIASVAGDAAFDMLDSLSFFRALGFFLCAWASQRLWAVFPDFDNPQGKNTTWTRTLRFIFTCWPGCFIAAVWQAFGAEWLRAYPFIYIASILTLNNLLFCTLLGLPLYRLMARHWVINFGTWRRVMAKSPLPGATSIANAGLIVIGAFGAGVVGWYVSETQYKVSLWQPFVLGTHTGVMLAWAVAPFLVMPLVGLLRK